MECPRCGADPRKHLVCQKERRLHSTLYAQLGIPLPSSKRLSTNASKNAPSKPQHTTNQKSQSIQSTTTESPLDSTLHSSTNPPDLPVPPALTNAFLFDANFVLAPADVERALGQLVGAPPPSTNLPMWTSSTSSIQRWIQRVRDTARTQKRTAEERHALHEWALNLLRNAAERQTIYAINWDTMSCDIRAPQLVHGNNQNVSQEASAVSSGTPVVRPYNAVTHTSHLPMYAHAAHSHPTATPYSMSPYHGGYPMLNPGSVSSTSNSAIQTAASSQPNTMLLLLQKKLDQERYLKNAPRTSALPTSYGGRGMKMDTPPPPYALPRAIPTPSVLHPGRIPTIMDSSSANKHHRVRSSSQSSTPSNSTHSTEDTEEGHDEDPRSRPVYATSRRKKSHTDERLNHRHQSTRKCSDDLESGQHGHWHAALDRPQSSAEQDRKKRRSRHHVGSASSSRSRDRAGSRAFRGSQSLRLSHSRRARRNEVESTHRKRLRSKHDTLNDEIVDSDLSQRDSLHRSKHQKRHAPTKDRGGANASGRGRSRSPNQTYTRLAGTASKTGSRRIDIPEQNRPEYSSRRAVVGCDEVGIAPSWLSNPQSASLKEEKKNRDIPLWKGGVSLKPRRLSCEVPDGPRRDEDETKRTESPNMDGPLIGTCTDLEKRYFRLQEISRACDVRPRHILESSFKYVQDKYERMKRDPSCTSVEAYNYITEQLKAIRQDLVVQGIDDVFTCRVLEAHARLCLNYHDLIEFNQAQGRIRELHSTVPDVHGPVRVEFLVYRIVYCGVLGKLQSAAVELRQLAMEDWLNWEVEHAVEMLNASLEDNFSRIGQLISPTCGVGAVPEVDPRPFCAPFLVGELVQAALPKLRQRWLLKITRSMRPTVPLSYLCKALMFTQRAMDSQDAFASLWGFLDSVHAVYDKEDNILHCAQTTSGVEAYLASLNTRSDAPQK